nr:hypothetical protein [Microbacterium bovistercoris]
MIGGRKAWIAWPAGLLCAGVVAGLAWLAAPGIPAAVQFAGDLLRSATAAEQAASAPATARPIESIGTAITDDCRSLYPDKLWVQLSWQPHVVLDQSQDPPATAATGVRDALTPDVLMTCAWRDRDGGTVVTTLAKVDAAAAAVARPGFASQGFHCTDAGGGIRCARTSGRTTEENVVRDGMWLSTTEQAWHPSDYTDELVRRLWP